MQGQKDHLVLRILILLGYLLLALGGIEMILTANHSGEVLGRFSAGWIVGLILYSLMAAILGLIGLRYFLKPQRLSHDVRRFHERLGGVPGSARPILSVAGILLPSMLMLSPWGYNIESVTVRSLVFVVAVILVGIGWVDPSRKMSSSFLWGALLVAGAFEITKQFNTVTNYPFKLGWSEGNRLWDYSLYFGRDLYQVVGEFSYPSYLTPGRHGLWGIPFLLAHTPIELVRFWDGLMWTLPYLLLGLTLFAKGQLRKRPLLLAALTLWSFLFIAQGPIYAPLVWGAVLLFALYQRDRLWLSLLATALACFYVGISRWTWLFAPAVWIAVWALLEEDPSQRLWSRIQRSIWLGLAGFVGGVLSQILTRVVMAPEGSLVPVSLEQPLLWYRLLPNPTYPLGILINLAIAVVPLLLLLLVFARRYWSWDWLQWLAVGGSLTGFLAAGLVASVKIGGGSNLHNLDMFLVAMLVLAAQTILRVSERTQGNIEAFRPWTQALFTLAVLMPAWWALRAGTPLKLPPTERTEAAVREIRSRVEDAAEDGLILFIDQRQLLTFGQVEVPLVMDYELKHLTNQAMGDNAAYFERFEQDLQDEKYRMIIVHPLSIQYQGRTHQFGEENDAFVRWAAIPLLEHYEPTAEFDEHSVWLMEPIPD
ncbi:MAG: hypothetical protein ACLFWD_13585 [Anaerolineales bacterium]